MRIVVSALLVVILGLIAQLIPATGYAQDGEDEAVCDLNDARLDRLAGIAPADNGWWVIPDGESQGNVTNLYQVGSDCNVHEAMQIDHRPLAPGNLALDGQNRLWISDVRTPQGEVRDSGAMTVFSPATPYQFEMFRFSLPQGVDTFDTAAVSPDGSVHLLAAQGDTVEVYTAPGTYQAWDTPVEKVGELNLGADGTVLSAAFDSTGKNLAVRTAKGIHEFAVDTSDWGSAKDIEPVVTEVQGSASDSGFNYDGDGNFITASHATTGDVGKLRSVAAAEPPEPKDEDAESDSEESSEAASDDGSFMGSFFQKYRVTDIVKYLTIIAVIGFVAMASGIYVMVRNRKARRRDDGDAADDDDDEWGERVPGSDPAVDADDDLVKVGVDSGAPDEDFERVAQKGAPAQTRGEDKGAANATGTVYGAGNASAPSGPAPAKPPATGSVYGGDAASSRPSAATYGAPQSAPEQAGETPPPQAPPKGGTTYGNRGSGSVYGSGSPGRGSVYGSGGGQQNAPGSVYGGQRRDTDDER